MRMMIFLIVIKNKQGYIRHIYGGYETRAQARRILDKVKKEYGPENRSLFPDIKPVNILLANKL